MGQGGGVGGVIPVYGALIETVKVEKSKIERNIELPYRVLITRARSRVRRSFETQPTN